MNVGIINFHCAHNYGAMLQAYALQEEVKKYCDVKIINFEPKEIMFGYELYNPKILLNPRRTLGTMLKFNKKKMKYDVFESFKKQHMDLTKKYKTNIECDGFDAVICGSDQVWNMDLNGGLKEYLLEFVPDETKRIAYAASIGSKRINEKYIDLMKNEISKFKNVSVRESDAVRLLKDTMNIEAVQVLDPVFLKSDKEWDEILIESEHCLGDYVLLYGLEENELFEKTFKFIKENYGLKIINISPVKKQSKYIDLNLYDVGPREFIGMIKNASIVFTNSFHGTCFSIIYGKKFFTVGHSELNSRLESILKITNLEKHMINSVIESKSEFERIIRIDKNDYKEALNKEIKKSKAFLKNALLEG